MGIFSGANDRTPASSNNEREEIPFFEVGQRHLVIDKCLLRRSTRKGSRSYKQWMVITEFSVKSNLSGTEQRKGKTIETLERDPDGELTVAGGHAMDRVLSLVSAALGGVDVGEEVLDGLFGKPPEDGKFAEATKLSGLEVIGTTTTFKTNAGGTMTPTTFGPIEG